MAAPKWKLFLRKLGHKVATLATAGLVPGILLGTGGDPSQLLSFEWGGLAALGLGVSVVVHKIAKPKEVQ